VLKSSPLSLICLDLFFWHEADVAARSDDVCSWGKTGRHLLVESLSGFDPELASRPPVSLSKWVDVRRAYSAFTYSI
jgi:hypothetical protein